MITTKNLSTKMTELKGLASAAVPKLGLDSEGSLNANTWSEKIFNLCMQCGLMTEDSVRDTYKFIYDHIQHTRPDLDAKVKKRRDQRTLGEFALDIADNDGKEALLGKMWFDRHGHKLFDHPVKLEPFGCSSNGALIFKRSRRAANPDFKILDEDENLVTHMELKIGARHHKGTWKIQDLEHYVKFDPILMVSVHDNLNVLYDKREKWRSWFFKNWDDKYISYCSVGDAAAIQKMLDNLPRFDAFEMGRKPCVQLWHEEQKDIQKGHAKPLAEYLEIHEW